MLPLTCGGRGKYFAFGTGNSHQANVWNGLEPVDNVQFYLRTTEGMFYLK